MVEPLVVPRSEHSISRRDIDPDALKVLYRLRQHNHLAYLVGGSVRDLLLGRRPKDFDIGTSAHPYQVKKLFRNCWIIGRRFRLAHVKFGPKTIEVATFRRQVAEAELAAEAEAHVEAAAEPPPDAAEDTAAPAEPGGSAASPREADDRLIHRDNTFGTPEEDAFRRDFTINALFYDIATFSVIDYVGGLRDLDARLIRCIGDPDQRFFEDPVRMLRALVLAARLDFHVDPPVLESIRQHGSEIRRSSPARLLEEYYKILRSGSAESCFRNLEQIGLLEHLTPELHRPPEALWLALSALDRYRAQFPAAPPTLTNALLIGTLLAPLGLLGRRPREAGRDGRPREARVTLGALPIARRDIERLRQIVSLQPRLVDPGTPPRVQRALLHRSVLREALTWLEIQGDHPAAVQRWRALTEGTAGPMFEQEPGGPRVHPRRRRRRRRRRFPTPPQA
jgi:poly(A) polymerase